MCPSSAWPRLVGISISFGRGRTTVLRSMVEWILRRSKSCPACCATLMAIIRTRLAAVDLLRQHFPDLKIRVVNVVDLMTLQPPSEHPHGLSDREFDSIFTTDKPVIFAYHGYPWLIHRLCYRRHGH